MRNRIALLDQEVNEETSTEPIHAELPPREEPKLPPFYGNNGMRPAGLWRDAADPRRGNCQPGRVPSISGYNLQIAGTRSSRHSNLDLGIAPANILGRNGFLTPVENHSARAAICTESRPTNGYDLIVPHPIRRYGSDLREDEETCIIGNKSLPYPLSLSLPRSPMSTVAAISASHN